MDTIYEERATGFRANRYLTQKGQRRLQIVIPTLSADDEQKLAIVLAKATRDIRRGQVIPLHPRKEGGG